MQMSDSEIEQWVIREIRLDNGIGSKELCVFSDRGTVSLTGTVQDGKNKSAAERATHRVPYVVDVINRVVVKPPSAWRTGAIIALSLAPQTTEALTITAARTQQQLMRRAHPA